MNPRLASVLGVASLLELDLGFHQRVTSVALAVGCRWYHLGWLRFAILGWNQERWLALLPL